VSRAVPGPAKKLRFYPFRYEAQTAAPVDVGATGELPWNLCLRPRIDNDLHGSHATGSSPCFLHADS